MNKCEFEKHKMRAEDISLVHTKLEWNFEDQISIL